MKIYVLTCWYAQWNIGGTEIHNEVFTSLDAATTRLKECYEEDLSSNNEIYDYELHDRDYWITVENEQDGAVEYRGEITEHEIKEVR